MSNKFITWDVSTSDLARTVHPNVEGLMMDIFISPDNRFAAAYTNNSQTILLNTLVSEFVIIDNPLETNETVASICLLDTALIVYGQTTWVIFDTSGKQLEKRKITIEKPILSIEIENSKDDYSIIHWSGDAANPAMAVDTYKNGTNREILEFNYAIALDKTQSLAWVCPLPDKYDISMYNYRDGKWWREKDYPKNPYPLLQLELSQVFEIHLL